MALLCPLENPEPLGNAAGMRADLWPQHWLAPGQASLCWPQVQVSPEGRGLREGWACERQLGQPPAPWAGETARGLMLLTCWDPSGTDLHNMTSG